MSITHTNLYGDNSRKGGSQSLGYSQLAMQDRDESVMRFSHLTNVRIERWKTYIELDTFDFFESDSFARARRVSG